MHDSNPETTPAPPRWKPLDERQRRVLGVLIEKAKTTPAGYPMSVSAIVTGCNQKSNRDPVTDLDDVAVEKALGVLRKLGAVSELDWLGRVTKFKHQAYEWLGVSSVELAVLAELLLRGAQTLGDLRARASRMEPIADLAALRPIVAGLMERNLMIALTPLGRGQVVTLNLYPPRELADLRAGLGGSRAAPASVEEREAPPARAVHVRWADLPREPLGPSLERRFVTGRHMTLAQFFLGRGAVVPAHEHENEQFANVLHGCLRLRLGPESAEVVEGYYSICGSASRGPALGVIPEPIAGQTSVPITALLYHPHDAPAPRDGDYFNANCGFWSDQPAGPEQGVWTYDDWCRAGAFVESKAGQAYVAFVRLGTGRLGYDYGTITSAGTAEDWYCYDPEDLGAAAGGQKTPWQIVPSSMTRVHYPLGRTVTGACFDSRTGRLYLCVSWAYPDGLESFPIIHVYGAS